jgi:hypothetical protein
MTRYKSTPEGNIPFTPEEEAEWDALEAQAIAEAPIRKAAEVREQRNRLLSESDWTQTVDAPFDADGKLAWALYRETLRMIPQQDGFPETVNWPPKPE